MRRLTARFLLVLLLVSSLAPAALAISQPSSTTCCCGRQCCRRKHHPPMAAPQGPQAESAVCCHNHCGCSLVVPSWAEPGLAVFIGTGTPAVALPAELPLANRAGGSNRLLSARAPPSLSLT